MYCSIHYIPISKKNEKRCVLDYLVTKTTKQSIQMKLLSQFSNEKTQYIILPDYHANYTVYSFVSHIMSISQISFSKMLLNCSLSSTKLE